MPGWIPASTRGSATRSSTANCRSCCRAYQYSYFGQPDALGGRFSLDTGDFNVMRTDGTNTRRTSLTMNWERPFVGALGDLWKLTLHGDAAAYNATRLQ